MVNLIYRSRKRMAKRKLSLDFLKKITDLLRNKNSRLSLEQKKLIEEDPYLKEGRDVGNAEDIDEAILEDRAKVEIEVKKEHISTMKDQVDKALDKIDKGEYGICDNCGNEIDKARLEAYPEATVCMECSKKTRE